MIRTSLLTLLAVFSFGSFGVAGEDKVPIETVPIANDDFETHFRIDGWILQINTGIANSALGLSKNVFIGFDDILSDMDWVVPVGFDVRYKRIGFLPDLVALKMSGGGTTPGPFDDIGYRVSERFSVSAGYRYLSYELGEGATDLDLTASGPQITLNWKF